MQWVSDVGLEKVRAVADVTRAAVRANPGNLNLRLALGRVLLGLGEYDEANATLSEAVTATPGSAELRLALAHVAMAQDRFEDALVQIDAAQGSAPEDAQVRQLYFIAKIAAGTLDPAALESDEAKALLSSTPALMLKVARRLGPAGALQICDDQLRRDPAHTNAKYLKALALAELGRGDEASALIGLHTHVTIEDLPCPGGYESAEEFRAALADEIRANPTLADDPRSKATRGGQQTRQLRQPGAVAVETLLAQIRQAVDERVRRLDAADDFALGRPDTVRLNAWAVIYGPQGRQISHRHAGAWLSGVYYVAAPRPGRENAYRGALVLGILNASEHPFEPPWGIRHVEPVPGRLVMFPSYTPHATEPTQVDGARISVAFDVVPA
jgi:uncharacterized protein (TIGR02466 family)